MRLVPEQVRSSLRNSGVRWRHPITFQVNGATHQLFIDTRTTLLDALEVPPERVHLEIGDSSLPKAFLAGASAGTASWGRAIFDAASALRARLHEEYGGIVPAGGWRPVAHSR